MRGSVGSNPTSTAQLRAFPRFSNHLNTGQRRQAGFRRRFGREIPFAHTALASTSSALLSLSRPALSSSRGGSRDPSLPQDVVYGIARIDSSGRICERAVITALGWSGGDLLTVTADAGVVTARRDPGGMVTLPLPDQDSLAASSLAMVDQAIRAHGSFQHVQGGRP